MTPQPGEALREALTQIKGWCDASREDIKRVHGSEARLLFAVIPTTAANALAAPVAGEGLDAWAELRAEIEHELAVVDESDPFQAGAAAAYNFVLSHFPAAANQPVAEERT